MPSEVVSGRLELPDSIPWRRIARYALYSLGVFAAGVLLADAATAVLRLPTLLLYPLGDGLVRLSRELAELVGRGIRLFALLVAAGVFLSQFENPG